MAKPMVTTSDVAAHLSCSEETVRRMARERAIPYIKLGGANGDEYRFDVDEVVRALRDRERLRHQESAN